MPTTSELIKSSNDLNLVSSLQTSDSVLNGKQSEFKANYKNLCQTDEFSTKVNPVQLVNDVFDPEALYQARNLILSDQIVAFPTETVYGLGANALSRQGVQKIFIAKQRPQDNPLIIHISSIQMLENLLDPEYEWISQECGNLTPPSGNDNHTYTKDSRIPLCYRKLIHEFWPGPLTILLERPGIVPKEVSAGQDTIAVRMPSHALARAFIEACGVPLAAPSANTSGRPSPTLASHVFDDLKGRIPLILDGGTCQVGLESTVLDGLRTPPLVLRPGGVTVEQLQSIIGHIDVYRKDFIDLNIEANPSTPGMKYKHYSPCCPVIVVSAATVNSMTQIERMAIEYKRLSLKYNDSVGVLVCKNDQDYPQKIHLGNTAREVAQTLFSGLREMERQGVHAILVQGIIEQDEGLAVMNRLNKAASEIL